MENTAQQQSSVPQQNPPQTPPPPAPSQTPPPVTNEPPGGQKSYKTIAIILVIISIIALIGIGVSAFGLLSAKKKPAEEKLVTASPTPQPPSGITGTVGVNGIAPEGAYINILGQVEGQDGFQVIVPSVQPVDGTSWTWSNAVDGTVYEIKAQLIINDKEVAESDILNVVAPATEEILDINIPAVQAASISPTQGPATPTPQVLSSISGTFNINGYIAPGTTVSISARQVGSSTFTQVQSNLPAVDNSSWSWTNALQNAGYEIQATLVTPNGNGDQSQVLSLTAPAANEVLTINSTATPPTPTITGVSGTINFNGVAPQGSYITIGERVTGTTNFNQIASNLSATNGTTWSWSGAQAGQSYDLQAYLWINNQPAAQSAILTVQAPANNEILTLNAQTQPPAPNGNTISASCSNNGSGYQATVQFNLNNTLSSAQQYWLTIGSTGGGSQIVSNTITPPNPSQTQSYSSTPSLAQGQTYYAQYAYSTCSNCNTYSPFSPSISFTCN